MAQSKADRYAAAVLADPRSVIIDIVRGADPALSVAVCVEAIAEVAAATATQRRLAQALFDAPALMVSREPLGPPVLDRLIAALQQRGSTRVALPLCGRCHRQRRLNARAGGLRICGSCDAYRRMSGQTCGRCGERRHAHYKDWDGGAVCRTCARADSGVDQHHRLMQRICAINPHADADLVSVVVGQTLPTPGHKRRVADELSAHPLRLSAEAAYATATTMGLLCALIDAHVDGFTMPRCPLCARSAPLTEVLDGRRCCRRCYDKGRAEPCAGCGGRYPVITRDSEGSPLCRTCYTRQPHNQAICPGCGEQAHLIRVGGGAPICRRCRRAPTALCAMCGKLRQCYFADTDHPRCQPCSAKLLLQQQCSRCGHVRVVRTRDRDGAPICNSCGRPRATCRDCGRTARVRGWLSDGPRCKRCYPRHPESFRPCQRCGSHERLHHFGLCPSCAVLDRLHAVLGDHTGIPARLEPVFTALARSSAHSTLIYLDHGGDALLRQLRQTGHQPITHQLLDGYHPNRALRPLRDAMVCAGVLEPLDENLHQLIGDLDRVVATISDAHDRRLLRAYTTWKLLRRLRTQSPSRPVTRGQAVHARRKLLTAAALVEFLHQRGRRLAGADQGDIDAWQITDPTAWVLHEFLTWAIRRGDARPGLVIAPRSKGPRSASIADDQRWALVRKLLHDNSIDRRHRFAGLLVLLYAQPVSRIAGLRTDALTQRLSDRTVCLALGSEPIVLPTPLAELALGLVLDRPDGRAALARVTDHDWLLPGLRAGSPITSAHLTHRLKHLGIPARAARTTTLMDLAAQLPAAVLAALLGIGITTATDWATEAGPATTYAADLLHRAHPPQQ
ncbi:MULTISPECIES: hypothetical protein [Nocardia]|uniref:hypothetical protein n=1 Tax=Nocardia TaxID=1817 RepID=UPI00135A7F40|nr:MULTISPECIES: hypothetical protein [Nocardia]